MYSKTEVTFEAVPASDHEDVSQHEQRRRESYTPPGARLPVLIALLCMIISFIVLLQIAASKSVKMESDAFSTSKLHKRQITMTSVEVYPEVVQTITGTTITWAATDDIYPSTTMTIPATTQTITGATNTFAGGTTTVVEVISSQGGTTYTMWYQIVTISGTVTSIPMPEATTAGAYLDTSGYADSSTSLSLATNPSAYLDTAGYIGSSLTPTEATNPSAYLDPSTPVVNPTTNPSAYLDTSGYIDSSTSLTLATNPSAYLDTSSTVNAVTTDSAYLDTSTLIVEPTTNPSAYLDTSTLLVNSATTASAYLDTSAPTSVTISPSAQLVTYTSVVITVTSEVILTTQPSVYLDSSSPVVISATDPSAYLDASASTSTSSTTASEATTSAAYLQTSVSSKTSTSSVAGPSHSSQADVITLPQIDHFIAGKYTTSRYLIATYLAPICVVLLKCITGLVFASANMMEPFHRLARAGGANGRVSVLAEFLSSSVWTNIFSGIDFKRPLMLIVTTGFATSMILAPFASEAMSIKGSQICVEKSGQARECAPVWALDLICVRILQALLGLMLCIFLTYTILTHKRPSGIISDPTSIASIASLLGDDEFVQELREIPSNASIKEITKLVGENKYALGKFVTDSGDYAHGIYKFRSMPIDMGKTKIRQSFLRYEGPSRKGGFIQDVIRMTLSLGVFGIVLAYYLDMRNDPFNRFFNNHTFGPRFVFSLLALILDNRFKRLEEEVRIMQPYRNLYQSSGASANALLANIASSSYTSLPLALWRREFFLALVALVTILADVLIIVIIGVPFSGAELYPAFRFSAWFSMAILCVMAITSIAAMMWRRGNPPMPREPNTIISIALYLCASRVTEQLVSMSTMEEKSRNRSIRALRQSYWYGYSLGQDEKSRWMVDKADDGNHGLLSGQVDI